MFTLKYTASILETRISLQVVRRVLALNTLQRNYCKCTLRMRRTRYAIWTMSAIDWHGAN